MQIECGFETLFEEQFLKEVSVDECDEDDMGLLSIGACFSCVSDDGCNCH